MTNEMINKKIAELRKIEAKAAELKAVADDLRDQLKAELDSRQVDSINTGLHHVIYNCYEKSGVDTQKLKDAGLYDQYSKKSVVVQFRINDILTL